MTRRVENNIVIEDARIGFRNFAGVADKFNPQGNRHFSVFLDTELAIQLEEDGWNIKWLDPRDPDDVPQAHMQVAVSYDNIPPKVIMISGAGKTLLNEDAVEILDWVEIEMVDLIISPYNWEVNGKSGVKAYLKSLYITIIEDELAGKYQDIPSTDVDLQIPVVDDVPFVDED